MLGRIVHRLWPFVAVAAMLGGVAALSLIGRPGIRHVAIPPGIRHQITSQQGPRHGGDGLGPAGSMHWHLPRALVLTVVAIVLGLIALLALAVLGYVIWLLISNMFRRTGLTERPAPGATMSRRQQVLDAVDAGIAGLTELGTDARSAVIACWVRLEEVASAAGTARRPGDTSSELVARLLGAHQVSSGVLGDLAELYRSARYGTQPVDDGMRVRALAAFERLRDELEHSRSGPLAEDDSVFRTAATTGGSR